MKDTVFVTNEPKGRMRRGASSAVFALFIAVMVGFALFAGTPEGVSASETGTSASETDAAAKSVTSVIPVSVAKDGSGTSYTIRLKGGGTEQTLTLKEGESGSFKVTHELADTYLYTLTEDDPETAHVTADDAVYTVYVFVTEDAEGVLSSVVEIQKGSSKEKSDSALFTNIYKKPVSKATPTPTPTAIPANKVTTAKTVKTGDPGFALWIALLLASAVMCGVVLVRRGKPAYAHEDWFTHTQEDVLTHTRGNKFSRTKRDGFVDVRRDDKDDQDEGGNVR